jgi:para-nitrobenzyl esterase
MTLSVGMGAATRSPDRVKIDTGTVEGAHTADGGVRIFKGIPFAAPPVGALRWKAPEPAPRWRGVRPATEFGSRCMQGRVFADMVFRDSGASEDCLTLNVWTPAAPAARLPVMVWIYGGGFAAGATSEPRQDGEQLARKGVVVVSFNYRLGVFGFFSHPELARESHHEASGNYGLLDQVAALRWVSKNIRAFGGDPDNVTIFGESAGSMSVSALMASPLTRGLFRRAIGESGAFFGSATLPLKPLEESYAAGRSLAESVNPSSLTALRAMPAEDLLQTASRPNAFRFAPNVDGYFLRESVESAFASGRQHRVPLLAGWNADESGYQGVLAQLEPTRENFAERVRAQFGAHADDVLRVYDVASDEHTKGVARDLASDRFIGFSTWKWIDVHAATGGAPVFRYQFDQPPPVTPPRGAYHSAEIEFVFGTLASKDLPWRPEDTKVSDIMSSYWTNFAKSGNPNGPGLPEWPAFDRTNRSVMHLAAETRAAQEAHRERYEVLDRIR